MSADKNGPRCPNHRVLLVDCNKGVGICPISGARFTYSSDELEKKTKLRLNALGQIEKKIDWNVKHLDGDDDTW